MAVNFSPVATDTATNVKAAVNYIIALKISPEEKRSRLEKVFNLVGSDFYVQMFEANSELFDSTALGSVDYGEMTDQIERLSRKIVQNYNLGRKVDRLVQDFYDSALGQAQSKAFQNAVSLDRHPTLTRSIVGETCAWCIARAGVHVDPAPELFARHADCDCLFVVSGYNSRNGILNNYNKSSKRLTTEDVFDNDRPGAGSVTREGGLQIPKGKQHELETAEWLKQKVGGDIIVLNESGTKGVGMPDLLRDNREAIEVKRVSSLNSISNRMRKAIAQLQDRGASSKNNVVILDGRGAATVSGLTEQEIISTIRRRVVRAFLEDDSEFFGAVIVRRTGRRTLVIRP